MNYETFLVGKKSVTPADKKFVEKYIAPKIDENRKIVVNPFSRERFETNPLVAALVHFTQDLCYGKFRKEYLDKWGVPEGQKIQLYDRARYLILKIDDAIYQQVID